MIKLENIGKSFGNSTVIDHFNVEFPEREITAVLGPSGCGKTTMLNILAGLVKVDYGRVITEKNVSYLFQEPRLMPWLSVRDNIALVLHDKMSPKEVTEKVKVYLDATGISAYANYYPSQLSGGLKQRVAIARAFSYQAPLLLMDEPFKSLDLKIRFQLIQDFLNLWRQEPRTVITVTHDVKEAILLGNRIIVLSDKPLRVVNDIDIRSMGGRRSGDTNLFRLEEELLKSLLGINLFGKCNLL
jgi:NitT/TauT family transport system ATP-binding protein